MSQAFLQVAAGSMAEVHINFSQESFFLANQNSYSFLLNVILHRIALILPRFLITIEVIY